MTDTPYGDPGALRRALTDRLRRLARERGGSQLPDLQRQFAYDRLLFRVFVDDQDRWVLKGAAAMLARLQGHARHTVDIDLYHRTRVRDYTPERVAMWTGMTPGEYRRTRGGD